MEASNGRRSSSEAAGGLQEHSQSAEHPTRARPKVDPTRDPSSRTTPSRGQVVLTRIISGGQTGADQGGLAAGLALRLETGGTAPPGWITDTGPDPGLAVCGLVEGEPDEAVYPKRTRKNVADSDGTLWVGNVTSRGALLTLGTCHKADKPHIVNPTAPELRAWLLSHEIATLNVAGNRERTNPGISARTALLIQNAVTPQGMEAG